MRSRIYACQETRLTSDSLSLADYYFQALGLLDSDSDTGNFRHVR